MEKKTVHIIESIANEYYFYNKYTLWLFFVAFIIFAISGFIYSFPELVPRCLNAFSKIFRGKSHSAYNGALHLKTNREGIRYNINKLINKIICSAIIVGIGELLFLMGVKLDIEYVYFNAVVFIITVGATIAYGILLCLMFWQVLLPMRQCCRYIQLFIFLELFLLAVTQHLDVLEWVTATLGIISVEVMSKQLEKFKHWKRRLMHDFRCLSSGDMFYPVLAKQVKYFKETEGGQEIMCQRFGWPAAGIRILL